MTKIDLNKLDKSNWKSFPFEKIASKISETVDPNKTELDIYVGLEHIDAEDIHIRRKGTPSEVSGGKLKCYPGDVIFGKRRAYQRKAAIVDFEGICSAHAFVLRANPEVINPKLFPFFLHSDQFMHRMVDISVGGLSPTINWGDLKHQEFLLPPKEEQTKLAELLWAMDNVIEREKAIFHMCNISFKAEMNLVFVHSEEPYIRLKKHIDLSTGKRMKGGGQKEGEVLSIGGENIDDNGNLILDKVVYISEEFFQSMKSGVIQKEDILMMKDGAKTGKVAYVNEKIKAATNEHLFIVRSTNNYFLQEFIFFFLLSDFGQMQIQNFFHGIIGGVTREDVQDLKIPNYSIERQKVFINLFKSYRDSIKICSLKIDSSHTLLKSLINQVF